MIDAVFALIQDGKGPPDAEQVAERSGVSVSSIFRMFDGLDDMRQAAVEQFEQRYSHLLVVDFDDEAPRRQRIARLARSRIDLYTTAAPLLRMARHRALDHEQFAAQVGAQRMRLAEQVQNCVRVELAVLTPDDAANLAAAVDAISAPEAFEVLSAWHGRSPLQITTIWRRSIDALVATWCGAPSTEKNNKGASK